MRTLNDIKNFKWDKENGEWLDEHGNVLRVLWSIIKDEHTFEEHSISEKIEETEIDGIKYTDLIYVYGEGLVIADETQRYRIKVLDLINNTENEKKGVSSIKNKTSSINKKENNDITIEINKLTDSEIEAMFGAWALEEDREDLILYLIAKGYNVIV